MNYMPSPVPTLVKETLKTSACSSAGILPLMAVCMVENCGILCRFLQDTKNPDLMVPIPEITKPLPPEKSSCSENTSVPVLAENAANESLAPAAFSLFFGIMCTVIGIFNQ